MGYFVPSTLVQPDRSPVHIGTRRTVDDPLGPWCRSKANGAYRMGGISVPGNGGHNPSIQHGFKVEVVAFEGTFELLFVGRWSPFRSLVGTSDGLRQSGKCRAFLGPRRKDGDSSWTLGKYSAFLFSFKKACSFCRIAEYSSFPYSFFKE